MATIWLEGKSKCRVCGWKGHSVLEASDPDTPVQFNMECSNCGEFTVQFEDWEEEGFEPSEDWLPEPDGDDEGTLDNE
jgi:hypothetical protein